MTDALDHVRGVEAYWAQATGRSVQRLPEHQWRLLLDTLGLGIEQASGFLGAERPEYPTFVDWVIATAGPPDAERVARYHAAIDGAPLPEATARRLAEIEAMPPVLDAADLARWEETGVVVLRGAIDADLAAATADLLWQRVGATPDDPDSWYARPRSHGIMVQRFQHPLQDRIRRAPRIHKAFAQAWGTTDLWTTTDRMGFNPPERPGFPFRGPHLHWDESVARPIPFGTQGILYLTDTAADQGALQVVPGFHHRIDAWLDALGDGDPRTVDLSSEAVTVPADAGDLVIWRSDLPHGASANRAAHPRLVQYLTMYPPAPIPQRPWI